MADLWLANTAIKVFDLSKWEFQRFQIYVMKILFGDASIVDVQIHGTINNSAKLTSF